MDPESQRCLVSRRSRDPEVYPRPDGEVYVCGMSDGEPLPVDPAEVKVNEESCRVIQRDSAIVSSRLGSSASLKTTQACYLPTPRDGLPVIGKVPGVQGKWQLPAELAAATFSVSSHQTLTV